MLLAAPATVTNVTASDALRALVVIACGLLLGMIVREVRRTTYRPTRLLFTALALFAVGHVLIESSHFGEPAPWWLFITVVAALLGSYGIWRVRKDRNRHGVPGTVDPRDR
jgi:hypothetical protein